MVTVESATMDDAAVLVDLWVDLVGGQRRYGSHLSGDGSQTAMRATFAQAAATGGLDVARDGTDVVGFVHYDVERGALSQDVTRGTIRDLYVVPERRDEGIGSALLDAAEATLVDGGVDVISVAAMADNRGAVRLYERRGYRPHRIEFEREVENDKRSRGDS